MSFELFTRPSANVDRLSSSPLPACCPSVHNSRVAKKDKNPKDSEAPVDLAARIGMRPEPPQAAPLEKTFAREEIMLPVKCNQHPWMKMYLNVVKNPFFAVTDKDGKYELKGLPPGDYTIAFVQEKLGEQTQKVTVAAKDSKTVDAAFKQ